MVVYSILLLMMFSLLAIALNLFQYQYFSQIIFLLSISSIFLLLFLFFVLFKINLLYDKKESDIQQSPHREEIKEQQWDEDNLYIKLISGIDSDWPIEKKIKHKFQNIADEIQLLEGLFYLTEEQELNLKSTYALAEDVETKYIVGEGLVGQVAKDGLSTKISVRDDIDMKIKSGLGQSKPNYLYLLPVKKDEKILGVVELAVFIKLDDNKIKFLEEIFAE